MLRKIGALSLGLMCVIAVWSFAGVSAAEEAPTIGELEAFAGTAEEPAAVDVDGSIAEAEAKLAEDKPYVARSMALELLKQELTAAQRTRLNKVAAAADKAIQGQAAQAAAAAEPEVAPALVSKADQILAEYVRKLQVEQEARRAQAAELVEEAKHQLYVENKPEKAYELAKKAMVLDPENTEADDVKTEAGLQLGEEADKVKFTADKEVVLQPVRKQAALQALDNLIESGKELNAKGEHEEALKQLRRARANVSALSVYMDMSSERRQVENLIEDVQADYEEARLDLAQTQKQEAQAEAQEQIDRIADVKRKEQARRFDEVTKLIEDTNFDEARLVLEDMGMEDPADELVPLMLKQLSDAENDYEMKRINAARERGDVKLGQWESEREMMPEDIFNYPDKAFWNEVVLKRPDLPQAWRDDMEKRTGSLYPSARLAVERSAEDQAVYDHLDDRVPLSFSETPLTSVVEFLQQTTEVEYVLVDRDALALTSVTLTRETTLRNALDLITEQTDTDWKVERGAVKIGPPEALRDYQWLVYPVQDLLLSVSDTATVIGLGGTSGRGGISGGRGGFTGGGTGTSTGRTGGGLGQFTPADFDVSPQFGGTSTGGVGGIGGAGVGGGGARGGFGGGGGGRGGGVGAAGGGMSAFHAEFLIGFIKQTCGYEEGTWLNPDGGNDLFLGGGGGFGVGGGVGGAGGGPGGGFGGPGAGFGARPGGFGFGPGVGPGAPGGAGAAGGPAAGLPSGRVLWNPDQPGQLLIIQTAEVHRCIEELLKELRAGMSVQVQVDVRFLSVGTDFLREVGFNWPYFSLTPDKLDSAGNLQGFGLSSGAYGGFVPWLEPSGTVIQTLDDEGNVDEATFFLESLLFGFGNPYGAPDVEPTEIPGVLQHNVYSYEKAQTAGTPFMGTGVPFFGEPSSGLNLDIGFGYGSWQLGGEFHMTHERDEVKTLSAPRITLTNGQAGFITVSTDRDYVSTYEVEDSILIPTVDTVSDAVDLAVRPVVSADRRYVFLELTPTILTTDLSYRVSFSTFVGQPGGTDGGASGAEVANFITLPSITDQTLATTVGVPDRGIVIVGGLTESTREQHEAGVPILDKIPILKRLFSGEGRRIDRSTLFVLAHPRIIILGEEEGLKMR